MRILGWIFGILLLLLFLPLSFYLRFDSVNGSVRLDFRTLFFRYTLFGGDKKTPRLKGYEIHALRKSGKRKKAAEQKKTVRKTKKKKTASGAEKPKRKNRLRSLRHTVRLVFAVIGGMVRRFGKWIRVDVKTCNIRIAAGDPAETAVLYGSFMAAAEFLWETVKNTRPMRHVKKSAIAIYADFSSGSASADGTMVFSLFLWQVLDILLAGGIAAIRQSGAEPKEPADAETAKQQQAARAEVIAALKE